MKGMNGPQLHLLALGEHQHLKIALPFPSPEEFEAFPGRRFRSVQKGGSRSSNWRSYRHSPSYRISRKRQVERNRNIPWLLPPLHNEIPFSTHTHTDAWHFLSSLDSRV